MIEEEYIEMPEDVMFRILLFLPVVSLLRFKSVCKSWRSFIESSHFITQHLKDNGNHHLIITNPNIWTDVCFCFSLFNGNNFQICEGFVIPHPNEVSHAEIIASCNGIICLDLNFNRDVSLWNPATKHYRVLPNSTIPIPSKQLNASFSFGFGFDVKTNDYKIVRIIIEYDSEDITLIAIKYRVDVYSLSTDSWRTIDAVLPVNVIHHSANPKAPFRSGTYCWLGVFHSIENGSFVHRHLILSFDFSSEVFGTMALPDIYSFNSDCSLTLALLGGNIACIDRELMENYHCRIWVLNEYGVKESWTKLYMIRLEPNAYPLGFSMNGMLVWKKTDPTTYEASLCLCDPVTEELTTLPFQGTIRYILQVAVHCKSLVSIKSTGWETSSMTCPREQEE